MKYFRTIQVGRSLWLSRNDERLSRRLRPTLKTKNSFIAEIVFLLCSISQICLNADTTTVSQTKPQNRQASPQSVIESYKKSYGDMLGKLGRDTFTMDRNDVINESYDIYNRIINQTFTAMQEFPSQDLWSQSIKNDVTPLFNISSDKKSLFDALVNTGKKLYPNLEKKKLELVPIHQQAVFTLQFGFDYPVYILREFADKVLDSYAIQDKIHQNDLAIRQLIFDEQQKARDALSKSLDDPHAKAWLAAAEKAAASFAGDLSVKAVQQGKELTDSSVKVFYRTKDDNFQDSQPISKEAEKQVITTTPETEKKSTPQSSANRNKRILFQVRVDNRPKHDDTSAKSSKVSDEIEKVESAKQTPGRMQQQYLLSQLQAINSNQSLSAEEKHTALLKLQDTLNSMLSSFVYAPEIKAWIKTVHANIDPLIRVSPNKEEIQKTLNDTLNAASLADGARNAFSSSMAFGRPSPTVENIVSFIATLATVTDYYDHWGQEDDTLKRLIVRDKIAIEKMKTANPKSSYGSWKSAIDDAMNNFVFIKLETNKYWYSVHTRGGIGTVPKEISRKPLPLPMQTAVNPTSATGS